MENYIAKNIRHLRRKNDWTQQQLADKINVKRSLVGAWEEGRSEPKAEDLISLSKALSETVDNILKVDLKAESENIATTVR